MTTGKKAIVGGIGLILLGTAVVIFATSSPSHNRTIAGVDSNSDGIRDDIEEYIVITYPNSPRAQAVMRQMARAHQISLLEGGRSVDDALRVFGILDKAIACGWGLYGESFNTMRSGLLEEFLDTRARKKAYAQFGARLAGQTSRVTTDPVERLAACEFDVEAVPI